MQRECARYVNMRFAPYPPSNIVTAPATGGPAGVGSAISSSRPEFLAPGPSTGPPHVVDDVWPLVGPSVTETHPSSKLGILDTDTTTRDIVDGVGIVELYASLRQGQSVRQWYLQHSRQLANIDVRRFITFGIIKGFLYRVHKYAYATGEPAPPPPPPKPHTTNNNLAPLSFSSASRSGGTKSPYAASVIDDTALVTPPLSVGNSRPVSEQGDGHSRNASASFHSGTGSGTGTAHPNANANAQGSLARSGAPASLFDDEEEDDPEIDKTLSKYLDGMHCFDQICTELEVSEKELTARLKRCPGEVLILHR